jgi:hypothetical protein
MAASIISYVSKSATSSRAVEPENTLISFELSADFTTSYFFSSPITTALGLCLIACSTRSLSFVCAVIFQLQINRIGTNCAVLGTNRTGRTKTAIRFLLALSAVISKVVRGNLLQ